MEFPIYTQIGTFENEQQLEQWMLSDEFNPIDYGYLIKASQVIYTSRIQEYLIRYKMQKEYNIFSYSQNFDKIPADWVDMLWWIDACMNKALKEKRRLDA